MDDHQSRIKRRLNPKEKTHEAVRHALRSHRRSESRMRSRDDQVARRRQQLLSFGKADPVTGDGDDDNMQAILLTEPQVKKCINELNAAIIKFGKDDSCSAGGGEEDELMRLVKNVAKVCEIHQDENVLEEAGTALDGVSVMILRRSQNGTPEKRKKAMKALAAVTKASDCSRPVRNKMKALREYLTLSLIEGTNQINRLHNATADASAVAAAKWPVVDILGFYADSLAVLLLGMEEGDVEIHNLQMKAAEAARDFLLSFEEGEMISDASFLQHVTRVIYLLRVTLTSLEPSRYDEILDIAKFIAMKQRLVAVAEALKSDTSATLVWDDIFFILADCAHRHYDICVECLKDLRLRNVALEIGWISEQAGDTMRKEGLYSVLLLLLSAFEENLTLRPILCPLIPPVPSPISSEAEEFARHLVAASTPPCLPLLAKCLHHPHPHIQRLALLLIAGMAACHLPDPLEFIPPTLTRLHEGPTSEVRDSAVLALYHLTFSGPTPPAIPAILDRNPHLLDAVLEVFQTCLHFPHALRTATHYIVECLERYPPSKKALRDRDVIMALEEVERCSDESLHILCHKVTDKYFWDEEEDDDNNGGTGEGETSRSVATQSQPSITPSPPATFRF